MDRMSSVFLAVLAMVTFLGVSAEVAMYTVTFVPCVPNTSCPQGNPSRFNATFAVNGIISPQLYVRVGDRLVFNLATDVPIHPLSICRDSPLPKFCADANSTTLLNEPITVAGDSTSTNFTMPGTYFYGCNYHPGMGATITVFPASTDRASLPLTNVQHSRASMLLSKARARLGRP